VKKCHVLSHLDRVILIMFLSSSKCIDSSTSHNQSEMLCLNVLSITTFELLQHIVNYELRYALKLQPLCVKITINQFSFHSVPQSIILGRSHTFNINWTEAIYIRYVLMSDEKYFKDYLERMDLSENMIENIVKK
jgi:glycosylphosphatidylinositol transamidase (GPIT) subunit GPI8